MNNEKRVWTRREMLSFITAFGTQFTMPSLLGCGETSVASGMAALPIALNPQSMPSGTQVPSTLAVSATVTAPLSQGYLGLSYEKSAISRRTLTTASTGIVKLFLLLNSKGVLRVGGNSADSTVYIPNSAGNTVSKLANSDIDLFATFVQTVNCSVIYGINLKGFLASPPTQTIANAVAEAVYAAKALGGYLQAFEIGNEPDLYSGYSYSQYVALWDSVAAAINAAVPGIPTSGPAIASTGKISSWTQPFAAAEKNRNLTLLTQHRYIAATGTDATLLNDVPNLSGFMQSLQNLAASNGVAWRMSETGSFYGTTYSQTTGSMAMDFATALWVIDYLFTNVKYGGQGVNMHNGNLIQYSAYVPFSDDEVNSITFVNSVYYGMLLFALGGYGSLVQSTLSSPVSASAYSVMVDATHYSTWIINKDQTASQSLAVTVTLPSAVKSATLKILQGTALNAHTGTTLQGSAIGLDGSFNPAPDYTLTVSGNTVSCYVPYNSAILMQAVLS